MPEISESRYVVQAGWDDVPHLDEKTKRELLDSTPPHLKEARTQGMPSLGAGAIYPVPWGDIETEPFAIPAYWKRGYALDVGWNRTAALWGAQDPTDLTIYLYSEYYRGQAEPAVHAEAVKARGNWIRGAIDPAARARGQADGEKLIETYRAHGLTLTPAVNAVEAGIYTVWTKLSTGKLKVFKTLRNFKAEYMLYRRDENGKIVKEFDHLMDDVRYLVNTWDQIASVQVPSMPGGGGSAISDSDAGY